jgi:hypothetical protein
MAKVSEGNEAACGAMPTSDIPPQCVYVLDRVEIVFDDDGSPWSGPRKVPETR